jgi:hypothetical protein
MTVYNEYERQAPMAERLDTPFGLLDIAGIVMDMLLSENSTWVV